VATTRRLVRWTAFGLVVALSVAACADDDDGAGPPPTLAGTTSSPVTTTTSVRPAPSTTASSTTAPTTAGTSPPTTAPAGRASAGCGQSPAVTGTDAEPLGDVPLAMTVGGQQRTYRLGLPTAYDPDAPAPLVLVLHGAGGTAEIMSIYAAVPTQAAARGIITATPDAIGGNWELGPEGADDQFLMALLDDIAANYCVDLARVHIAGLSLGAWKAAVTACAHPDRIASVALVTVEVHPGGCGPLSVVAFHGTGDHVVPYGEGADPGVVVGGSNAGLPGVSVNMPQWALGAGCSDQRDVVRIEPDVEHWTYRGCPAGVGVELYSIEHGDHTWPGSAIDRPGTTRTIDATELALDWFASHPALA
jgi:polyhydroxybutyrate depolymerase